MNNHFFDLTYLRTVKEIWSNLRNLRIKILISMAY
jgi:hypothetical protein